MRMITWRLQVAVLVYMSLFIFHERLISAAAFAQQTGYIKGLAQGSEMEGICARVGIHLDQQTVITKNAFIATLQINNEGDINSLEQINVSLEIKDEDGNNSNHLFEIYSPQLIGLTDVGGGGILNPGTQGIAKWLIVPTSDAAPNTTKIYRVGGMLSYVSGGGILNIPLWPAEITVLPNPNLKVKYFLEREVYGDDPFTEEIVEPAAPFSLGVMVTNNGFGTAKDVSITSSLPKIVDNEKGLLIDFNIIGTQVGTQGVKPSLKADFGDIAAGQTSAARWLMTSSLQGKFIDYHADFKHIDGMGNPRLSLVEDVEIYEMEHVVCVDYPKDDKLADFLVNDVPDIENMPDKVYCSDGAVLPVNSINNAQTVQSGEDIYTVTASCTAGGWQYIRIDNPSAAGLILQSVVRSDGKVLRMPENAWLTHKVIREAGKESYAQDRLHIFDYCSEAPVTYTLTYGSTDTQLPVLAFVDLQNISGCQFSITVTDNVAVDISTFDSHDIQVRGPNGFVQDAQLVSMDNISDGSLRSATYQIILSSNRWTSLENGQYTLWLSPDAISDTAGNRLPATDQPIAAFGINYQKDGGIILSPINKKRVGRTIYEYEYAVTLLNWAGVKLDKCTFEVLGLAAGATLVENNVHFNYVKPNQSAAGKGILKIRIDHTILSSELTLDWRLSCYLLGDFNCDGVVDIVDVGSFATVWLEEDADFDLAEAPSGDSVVNLLDFGVIAENWLVEKEK